MSYVDNWIDKHPDQKCHPDTFSIRPTWELFELIEQVRDIYPGVSRNKILNDILTSSLKEILERS